MSFDINASAPGKILWIGGYSVLERPNISYVTATKTYVNVNVRSLEGNNVELNAPQLKLNAKGMIDTSSGKLSIEVPKELILLKTALETGARYASALGMRLEGFSVNTKNDDAFSYSIEGEKIVKSGLGSSAALTVAAVAAVLSAFEVKANKNQIHKLAQTAHSIATGKVGSGFDIAAATFGSILYTRYSPELVKSLPPDYTNHQLLELAKKRWDCVIEKLPLPKDFRLIFANFIGESMITIQAVGSVSDFKKNKPEKYADVIKRLNDENVRAVEALKKINNGESDAMEEFKDAFDKGRAISKELGMISNVSIEPDDCTQLIEESKQNGAFVAKLPGAGGKDAIAALATSRKDHARLKRFWKEKKELNLLNIKLSKRGLKF